MQKKNMLIGLAIASALAGIALLANTDKGRKMTKKWKKKGLGKFEDWKHKAQDYADSKM